MTDAELIRAHVECETDTRCEGTFKHDQHLTDQARLARTIEALYGVHALAKIEAIGGSKSWARAVRLIEEAVQP